LFEAGGMTIMSNMEKLPLVTHCRRLLVVSLFFMAAAAEGFWRTDGKPPFSLEPGTELTYRKTVTVVPVTGQSTNMMKAVGLETVEVLTAPPRFAKGSLAARFRTLFNQRWESQGRFWDLSGGGDKVWEWKDGNLYLHGARTWTEETDAAPVHYYDPPLLYLKSLAKVGDTWPVGETAGMGLIFVTEARVEKIGSVTVPAGRFSGCLNVLYVSRDVRGVLHTDSGMAQIIEGTFSNSVWYAGGVGVVKDDEWIALKYKTGDAVASGRQERNLELESRRKAR